MKPHLFRRHGIWHCATDDGVMGEGLTPNDAWCDWHIRAFAEWSRRWTLILGPAHGTMQ